MAAREVDHGNGGEARIVLQTAAQVAPVDVRKIDVEEDQIGQPRQESLETFVSGSDGEGFKARLLQDREPNFPQQLIIVDNEDATFGMCRRDSRSRRGRQVRGTSLSDGRGIFNRRKLHALKEKQEAPAQGSRHLRIFGEGIY
jgi:hypothetical protein